MKKVLALVSVAALASAAQAQIVQINAGNLVNPQVLDFEAFTTGPVSGTDPLFAAFGVTAFIVNDPGVHFAAGDRLTANVQGNGLVSVNNRLAIAGPQDLMDNQEAGAGWGFRVLGGLHATQFGFLVIDQVNHSMEFQTYRFGVLVDSLTFQHSGSFPNPEIYFETTLVFDEVRFLANPDATGGWGVDNLTLGNVIPAPSSLALLGLGGLIAARRRR